MEMPPSDRQILLFIQSCRWMCSIETLAISLEYGSIYLQIYAKWLIKKRSNMFAEIDDVVTDCQFANLGHLRSIEIATIYHNTSPDDENSISSLNDRYCRR
jgi:hypothetical protein